MLYSIRTAICYNDHILHTIMKDSGGESYMDSKDKQVAFVNALEQIPMEEQLKAKFFKYKMILNIIEDQMDLQRVATISQKKIALEIGINQTNVSTRIKKLVQNGAIEIVGPGKYKLLHNDYEHTPYKTTAKVYRLFNEQPELFRKYKGTSGVTRGEPIRNTTSLGFPGS